MEKPIYAMTVVLLFGMGAAQAKDQMGRWATPDDPTAKTITALEDMWAHTACSSVPDALKAAFAEDFQGTAPKGKRYGKPTGDWGGEGDDTDCQLQQIQIRLFGDSVAVAYGDESSVSKERTAPQRNIVWPGRTPG